MSLALASSSSSSRAFPTAAPFGGGLDKFELRLPLLIPMRPSFSELIRATVAGERKPAVRGSRIYQGVIDLRPEYPALLHWCNKFSTDQSHKLEFLESGRMSFSELLNELDQMFDVDPLSDEGEEMFQSMRIDTAVDLPDVSVRFFRDNARISYKQFGDQFGSHGEQLRMLGKRGVETVMSGTRPNCYRIYNKRAKWQEDYKAFLRKWRSTWGSYRADPEKRDQWIACGISMSQWYTLRDRLEQIKDAMPEPPSFEEMYGIAIDAILTRVERQMGACETNKAQFGSIRTLRKLRENAAEFNPFERFIFVNSGSVEPNPADYSLRDYFAGMYFRQMIEQEGYAAAVRWATPYANGNMKRFLESMADFLPQRQEHGFNAHELFERYREAIKRQIAA